MTREEAEQYIAEATTREERVQRKLRVFGALYGFTGRDMLALLRSTSSEITSLEQQEKNREVTPPCYSRVHKPFTVEVSL